MPTLRERLAWSEAAAASARTAAQAAVADAEARAAAAEARIGALERSSAAALAAERAARALAEAGLKERVRTLGPLGTAANAANAAIDVLTVCAQFGGSKYAHDLRAVGGLCRATRAEEALWSALSRVQHGPKKRTALMYAAAHCQVERVRWLLARGAPRDQVDKDLGLAALHYATMGGGQIDITSALLEAGANPNVAMRLGLTPLHLAAKDGQTASLRLLLAAGAKVDVMSTSADKGGTPLMMASRNGKTANVLCLLAAGAGFDLASEDGSTALHVACKAGHDAVVVALLAAGAKRDLLDRAGRTALSLATLPAVRALFA